MYRKISSLLIFITLCFPVYYVMGAQQDNFYIPPLDDVGLRDAESDSKVVYSTLKEISDLALRNNFDIQLAQFDAMLRETDLDKAVSLYDIIVKSEARFTDNQRREVSTFSGTRSRVNNYSLSVSQRLPTGTNIEMNFDNTRSWTDYPLYTTVNPAYESSVRLALKQELSKNFFGLNDRSRIKITRIEIQNARYTSLDKIEQMLAEVQRLYWVIARDLDIVCVRREMYARASELFQLNKDKIKKGIIEKPQLVSSEANLKQKEIDLLLAQNELKSHINELKFLLNLEDKKVIILPGESLECVSQEQILTEALKVAFSHRRDYLRAKNDVRSQDLRLIMKRNSLWPEINLEASISRNGLNNHLSEAINDISSEDNPEYFLGFKITFPLQNREARSEFNKAKIEKTKALINLKKTEYRILTQIKNRVRDCNILRKRVDKQRNVVRLQEEKLTAELKAYRYGRSDTDTIIRYQNDLLLSRIMYSQALLEYREALIELLLSENCLLDKFWKDTL